MDRCALFVDASYALADGAMAVHGTRRRDSVSWDHAGLLKLLAGLARDRTGLPVLRCYWYETASEGRRTPEHDALAEMPGLKLRLVNALPGRREGIESQLRKDLVTLAKSGAISDAFIASASEQVAEIVAEVQDLGLRVVILHIASDGGWTVPLPLRQECDDIVEISGVHLRSYVELIRGAEPVSADEQYKAAHVGAMSQHGLPAAALNSAPVYQVSDGGYRQQSGGYVGPGIGEASASASYPAGQPIDSAAVPAPAGQEQAGAPPAVTSAAPPGSASTAGPGLPYEVPAAYAGSMAPLNDARGARQDGSGYLQAGSNGSASGVAGQPGHGQPDGIPGGLAQPGAYSAADQRYLGHSGAAPGFSGAQQSGYQGAAPGGYQIGSSGSYENAAAPNGANAAQAGAVEIGPAANIDGSHVAGQGMVAEGGSARPGGVQAGAGLNGAAGYQSAQNGAGQVGYHAGQYVQGTNGAAHAQPGSFPAYQRAPSQPAPDLPVSVQPSPAPASWPNGNVMASPAAAGQQGRPQNGMGPAGYQAGQSAGSQGTGVQGDFQAGVPQPDPRARDPYGSGLAPQVPSGADASAAAQPQYATGAPEVSYVPSPPISPGMDQSQRGAFGQNPGAQNFGGQIPGQGFGGQSHNAGAVVHQQYQTPQQAAPLPAVRVQQPGAIALPDAVKAAHAEGFTFGQHVGRDAPGLWLEAVLARKPRMPSDLEARLLQGSVLPIDSLLHDEVRHSLRRGFWDALESARR